MDILFRSPAQPPPRVPLAFREIRIPWPYTLGCIGAGLALGIWSLRPDFRSLALEHLSTGESCRFAGFLFLVAVALSAAATLLVCAIPLLMVKNRHAEAESLNRQYWPEAKEEISPVGGRNSTPSRRWLFLCGLASLQLLLFFAAPWHLPSNHWLNEAATRRGELKLWRLRTFGCIRGFLSLQLC